MAKIGSTTLEYTANCVKLQVTMIYLYICIALVVLLLQVQSFGTKENLAYEKPTIQSSTELGGVSSRAVDGDTDPSWAHGSCTHTQQDTNPWWAVDLLMSRQADRVDVTSTVGLTGIPLSHLHIGSTDENPNVTAPTLAGLDECVSQDSPVAEGTTQIFPCGSTGRFLVIMLEGNHVLSLCEVKVFEENIALGQATFQSSLASVGYSSKAVDGSLANAYGSGSCARSNREDNPWWTVDLQWRRLVERIHITGMTCRPTDDTCKGQLHNMYIGLRDESPLVDVPTVSNIDACVRNDSSIDAGETVVYPCGKSGRYLVIMVEATNRILRLCEVEVYTSEAASESFLKPDMLPRSDTGPIKYRPSLTNTMSKCSLDSLSHAERRTANTCLRQCLFDSCCKAVSITNSCDKSYTKSEALHFVKEGHGTTPTEGCSCRSQSFIIPAERAFSTFDAFVASGGNIKKITVYFDLGLKGLSVEYDGNYASSVGFRSHHKHECILDRDERITGVDVYEGLNGHHDKEIPLDLTFHTTKQTCGPFRQGVADISHTYHATGHQLLFVRGAVKTHLKLITPHFDYDCSP